jgi:hypothetical protein
MGNNRLPTISRIDQSVRDTDFIPITDLSEINQRLNEIIDKFNSSGQANSETINIAQKLKDIEYNMADALVVDPETGEIIGYNTTTDDEGNIIPLYGEDSIDTMLNKLQSYYNELVKNLGGDPNEDNWKIPLNEYFTEAITNFRNKIAAIFTNSSNVAAMEAKYDETNDYIKIDPIKPKTNVITRLNPDMMSYMRSVNIIGQQQYKNLIAFEVQEAESNSLVLNLKIQNGFLYYDLDIVLDNGKWHISKKNIYGKEIDSIFKLNIFKYPISETYSSYVFCLYTNYPDIEAVYNFEIQGVFVQKYSFNNTNLTIENHNKYYEYTLTTDTTPVFSETYYVKTTDNYTDEENPREIWVPYTNLTSFENGVEYYNRITKFVLSKSYDLVNDDSEGVIQNNVLVDSDDQIAVDKVIYNGELNKVDVSFDISEALDECSDVNSELYIKNSPKCSLDNSVQIYSTGTSTANVVNRNVKKVDNKIACGYGEALFDMVKLKPDQIVNCNSYLNKNATQILINILSQWFDEENESGGFNVEDNYRVVTKYDILTASEGANSILSIDDENVYINEYFRKNLSYVNSFSLFQIADKSGTHEHVIVLPDFEEWFVNEYGDSGNTIQTVFKEAITRFMTNYFYIHFITTKSLIVNDNNAGFVTVPVFRKMNNTDNMYMNSQEPVSSKWYSMISNGNITIATTTNDSSLYYSYYGDLWHKLEHPIDNRGIEIDFKTCELLYTGEFFIAYKKADNISLTRWFYSDDGLNWKTNPYIDTASEARKKRTYWWNSNSDYVTKIKIINSDRIVVWLRSSNKTKAILTDAYHFRNGLSTGETFQVLKGDISTISDVIYDKSVNTWILLSGIGESQAYYNIAYDNLNNPSISNLVIHEEYVMDEDYVSQMINFKDGSNDTGYLIGHAFGDNNGHIYFSNYDKFFTASNMNERVFDANLYYVNINELSAGLEVTVNAHNLGPIPKSANNVFLRQVINCSDTFINENNVEQFRNIFVAITSEYKAYVSFDNTDYWAQFTLNGSTNYEVYEGLLLGSDGHKVLFLSTSAGIISDPINNYLTNSLTGYNNLGNISFADGRQDIRRICGCCCSEKSYHDGTTSSHTGNNYNTYILADNYSETMYYNNDANYIEDETLIKQPRSWLEAVFASYNPIRNLYECDDRIVGETNLGAIGINYGYDDAYDPYRDYNLSTIEEKLVDPKLYKQYDSYRCYMEIDETNEKAIIWQNSSNIRKYDITGFTPNNYFFVSNGCSDGKTYIFFTSEFSTGIWYADFSLTGNNLSLTYVDIPIYATAIVENKYGMFVYGFDSTYERQKLYTNGKGNSSFVFQEALDVEMIDFFKAHNDEIIISTYDSEDPNAYYTCNMHDGDEYITFNRNEVLTIHNRFSFNEIIEHNGEIYFLNGSGSHPEVDLGLYKYKFNLDSNGRKNVVITQLCTMDNYFDGMFGEKRIDIIPNVENINDSTKTAYIVSVSGYNDMMDDSIENILIVDIDTPSVTSLDEIIAENASTLNELPYTYRLLSAIKTSVKTDHPGKFTNLVVQHSSYHVDHINTYNFNNQTDYNTDEFYFDLKNKTISLNNYEIAHDKRFVIETEKIAVGTNISEPKTNIVFILGQDNALALYDRTLPNIKVLKTKYVDNITGLSVPFDIDKNTLQSVIIGNGNTDKQIFVIVQGKFPTVINNYNTGVVTYDYENSEVETRLYTATVNNMLAFDNTIEDAYFELTYLTTYSGSANTAPSIRTDFKNYIATNYASLHLSDDLPLYHDTSSASYVTEYLGSFCNLLYDNTYSSAYWNIKKHCLQIKTKLKYNTSLTKKYDENIKRYYGFVTDENGNNITSLEKNKTYLVRNSDYMIDVETNKIMKHSINAMKWYYPLNITNKKIITPTVDWFPNDPDYQIYNNKDLNRYIIFDANSQLFKLNYIQHMQTQYGVFRFVNKSYMDAINDYYKYESANQWFDYTNYENRGFNLMDMTPSIGINNERYDITNLYFTPEGSNSVITIKPVNCGTIEEVYETYKGLFIYTKELKEFDGQIIVSHNMYRLKRIPDTNIASTVLLTNNDYFTELDIDDCTITDFRETKYGIFAIGYEPDEMWDVPQQDSTGEYHGAIHIFWYNGDDFISLATYNPSYRGISKPLVIIETREYLYIAIKTSYGVVNFLRYDPSDNSFEDVTFNPDKNLTSSRVSLYHSELSESSNYNVLISALIAHRKSMIYPKVDLDIENYDDKIVCWNSTNVTGSGIPASGTVVWNFETRTIERITNSYIDYGYVSENSPLYYIRYPIFETNNSTNENVKELLTKLHDANIPVNKNVKAVGAIFYRNHKILINGIKLNSNSESDIPQSIIFNIDPDFRLDDNVANATLRNAISNGQISDISDSTLLKANFTLIFDN